MSIGQQNKSNLMFYGGVALVVVLVAGVVFMQMRPKPANQMVHYDLAASDSLTKPLLTDDEITEFAARASADILSFEYQTYKEDLQDTRSYFTDGGWVEIQNAFKESGMLRDVVDREMDVNSIVTSNPTIKQQGVVNGTYTWLIEAPFLMVYHVGGDTIEERTRMTMRIVRSDAPKNTERVGITQIVLAPQ